MLASRLLTRWLFYPYRADSAEVVMSETLQSEEEDTIASPDIRIGSNLTTQKTWSK
jgi:hypothetical protein